MIENQQGRRLCQIFPRTLPLMFLNLLLIPVASILFIHACALTETKARKRTKKFGAARADRQEGHLKALLL